LPEISEEEEKAVQTQPGRETEQLQAHYEITSHGEVKPAWIAKWLFHDGQIHLRSWHIWMILGWLLLIGGGAVTVSYLG